MTPKRCVHSTGIALRNWCIEMARTHTDLLIDIDFILIPYSFIPLFLYSLISLMPTPLIF